MSRIGKRPIVVPNGVEIHFDSRTLIVKGPKGELQQTIHPSVELHIDDSRISLSISDVSKKSRSLFGLFRTLINNMVVGVTEGFQRTLEINGVGYRAEVSGGQLILNLGYSNPITYDVPQGISAQLEQRNRIILTGIDKELLGKTAAKIRALRPPEPYKGKGVKYLEERIRRKAGKTGIKK
jgi:large subunit ribosomal protein L6